MEERTMIALRQAGMDPEEALERFMGSAALYERFLKRFPADESFQQIGPALEAGDWDAAVTAAHTLKGVAGNLGMTDLYRCCSQLVDHLRAGEHGQAAACPGGGLSPGAGGAGRSGSDMRRETLLLALKSAGDRTFLRSILEQDYDLLEAENGARALLMAGQYRDSLAAVLLDADLPGRDGYEVLSELKRTDLLQTIPVVMVDAESEAKALELGAWDNIRKPFQPMVIARRMHNLVALSQHQQHLEELVERQAASLRRSNEAVVDTLTSVIEYRNTESGRHIRRIRFFTKVLLEELAATAPEYGLDARKIDLIAHAASLHDIGKIAIPDSILNKPGPLTEKEFAIMKTHTEMGARILAGLRRAGSGDMEYLRCADQICRYHHERWDGKGYPEGLVGDQIPISAQAVGVADVYDALTSDRVYKKAIPHGQAVNMILNGECGQFSPKLLECFKRVKGSFAYQERVQSDGAGAQETELQDVLDAAPEVERMSGVAWMTQEKYQAMLRYASATVVEIDLVQDTYHVVYAPDPDLYLLRTGATFSQSMENLVKGAVHPEDREMVSDRQTDTFFARGMTRRVRRYRIYHSADGTYRCYDVTLIRLDTGIKGEQRGLVIWQVSNGAARAGELRPSELPGGIQRCRNDRWYTLTGSRHGLAVLLGYTEEEIRERFHDHLLELLHPDDQEEARRKTVEQLKEGVDTEMEYRMIHKDGRVVWVLEKSRLVVEEDGNEYLYCLLLDVTRTKLAQEQLRLTLERHQIILEQTNDIIFEWDVASDRVEYSDTWEKIFGYRPLRDGTTARIQEASHLHPEDVPVFRRKLEAILNGSSHAEAEIRIAKADGRYLWCLIKATAQKDKEGKPFKVVGVIRDIDQEKRTTQALQAEAERDGLTKLYNKSSARRKIEAYLAKRPTEERAALLVIDMDNFKLVNDRYGHMFGDEVLIRIAERIHSLFRSGDVMGRIGGDEFMVFLQRIPDEKMVRGRCERLVRDLSELMEGELAECGLSCSIGVAMVPEHGQAFQDLFQRADRALYHAKEQGKDRYVFSSGEEDFPSRSTVNTRIDSDDQPTLSSDALIRRVLRRLYESGDVETALSELLEQLGKQFDVSRVYIFENTPDGKACVNTFEWCNEGISPQKDNLSYVTYEEDLGGSYLDNFDENDVFYCPDISRLPQEHYEILAKQGIKSILQCAIRDGGAFRGFVGIDECHINRLWTQEQIDALTLLSKLLSVFLLKRRAQEETAKYAEDLRRLLDAQNDWIYVVDPDTYELYFINAKTKVLTPDAREGLCCYAAFLDRSSPCGNCPMEGIRELGRRGVEFYNDHLDIWSQADASLIRWGGKEACLVTCHDITSYKRPRGSAPSD